MGSKPLTTLAFKIFKHLLHKYYAKFVKNLKKIFKKI